MSNNKQSIKLYTEEEIMNYLINHKSTITRYDLQNIPHIELPSDNEIEEMGKDVIIYNDTKRGWFVEGLKFMRDKIQGGNNEQQ